jgi:hypothetical protein
MRPLLTFTADFLQRRTHAGALIRLPPELCERFKVDGLANHFTAIRIKLRGGFALLISTSFVVKLHRACTTNSHSGF